MYLTKLDPLGAACAHPVGQQHSLSSNFVFLVQNEAVRFVAETCIHVLHRANQILGQDLYKWTLLDASACSCRDIVNRAPDQVLVFVGGADQPWRPASTDISSLRAAMRNAARVCVIGSAVFVPLSLGVLGAKRLAVHPEFQAGVRETYTETELHEDTTCHHKTLSSATGPASAIRMVIELIGAREGGFAESAIARDLGLQETSSKSRSGERWRLQRRAQGCKVICEALQIMDDHLEDTLSVSQVAEIISVSPRKLERLFSRKLGRSPLKIYRDLRLERAHNLLTQTALPLSEVTVACGFSNVTLMKRWFFRKYGQVPCDIRRQAFTGVH